MTDIFQQFYKGKTVLVTGHTGFKGSWLAIWLHEMGAKVVGLAQDPATDKDNFVLAGLADKIIIEDYVGQKIDDAETSAMRKRSTPFLSRTNRKSFSTWRRNPLCGCRTSSRWRPTRPT